MNTPKTLLQGRLIERKGRIMNCTGSINDGIYNCFGVYDHSLCYDCIHNSDSEAEEKHKRFIDFRDKLDVLYKFLQGIELPKGVTCNTPKLSPDKAFSVIWFLQEIMQCLPDNIELCDGCKELYDTDSEGFTLDDQYKYRSNGKTIGKKYWGHYCDGCVPPIDFELK